MTEMHPIDFHKGSVLLDVAKTYPTLPLTLLEAVQNALDVGATRIYVGVDLMEGRAAVLDNGDGVTVERFKKALLSVNYGIKKKGSLGRFGRGLMAPISLCQTMLFISSPRGTRKVHQWTFVGEQLKRQQHGLAVPYQEIGAFPRLPEPFTYSYQEARGEKRERVTWRTMVLLDRITTDSTIKRVDPEELGHAIRVKFSSTMRQLGTKIFIKVRSESGKIAKLRLDPTTYSGEALPIVVYHGKDCGEVTIKLFVARKQAGRRQGTVVLQQTDDNYPVTAKEARTQAMGARAYDLEEVKLGFDALCSGHFEGIITADKICLSPERNKFELNDALRDLYILIAEWYVNVGEGHITNARSVQKEERYIRLGEESLTRLMEELRHGGLSSLSEGLSVHLSGSRTSHTTRKAPTTQRPMRQEEPRRRLVKAKPTSEQSAGSPVSTFLQFAYETLEGSPRLWEYDFNERVLTFNIRHHLWVLLDETNGKHTARNDRKIMALQEWLAFKLLLLLSRGIDEEEMTAEQANLDFEVQPYIKYFIAQMK